ncbi:hypothetical protein [Streptomyces sp. ADI93-02]|uniref:hypothetical protein n=1 Tax=Streptomyces sp. ADI93-02 TaxID=1522757 RepID=UPI000F54D84D|nr:hypothetical protein [Streptomyces sp. ADI93-02]
MREDVAPPGITLESFGAEVCTRLRPSLWRREQARVATVSGRPVGAFLRMVGRQDTDQAESQSLGQMHGSATGAGLLNLWVRQ